MSMIQLLAHLKHNTVCEDSKTHLAQHNLGLQRKDGKIWFEQSIQMLYLIQAGIKHQQTRLLKPIPS